MKQYQAAIAIDGQFYMAMVNLAVLSSQKGDNTEAEKLLRQALAVRGDLYEVHYSLGLLLAEEKRYPEAIGHLESAVDGMPDFARAQYNLGQLQGFLRNGRQAQKALEHAYELEPGNPEYLNALVQHYLRHGKFAEVRRIAQNLSAENPNNPLAEELKKLLEKVE
jgi:tetratricopeptide (TPR) repeat protein